MVTVQKVKVKYKVLDPPHISSTIDKCSNWNVMTKLRQSTQELARSGKKELGIDEAFQEAGTALLSLGN